MADHDLPELGLCLAVAPESLAGHARLAAKAERAGAAAVSVGEARYDSFAAAALLAAGTSTIPVMTAVTTWARSPVATAVGALTVAELSQGRFRLGLGTMPPAWNRDFHGIDPARPLARLREYVTVLRAAARAWAGAPASVAGEFFSVSGYGADRTDPPPYPVPVHLAATRPAMARLAAEIGDGVVLNVVHTRRWLRERMLPALAAGEAAAGRRTRRTVLLRVSIHDGTAGGRARALAEGSASLALYRRVPYFREIAAAERLDPDRLDDEALVTRFVAVGTVDEVLERLAGYREGCDLVLLAPASGLTPTRQAGVYRTLLRMVARTARAPRGGARSASPAPAVPERR